MIEHVITSTVLILFILIISAVLENRINPCIKYALWLLVAVKLLVPLSAFENSINIMNLMRRTDNVQYIFVDNAVEKNADKTDNILDIDAEEKVTADNVISPATTSAVNLSTILNSIWICGMVLCAGVFLWSNIRFHIHLNQKRQLAGKYKNRLPIYEADGIGMPCLFGTFRPAIYLEKDYDLSEQQRIYVLEHEYTHFRHGDHIWAVVRCLCVILYWYNPFVWLAAHKSIADSELACDAGTLKQLAETEHISYGRTLIEMAENISKKKYSMRILECSTSAAGGMREMKKRIKMIAKRPHTRMVTLAVTLILCCGIVGCTFGRSADEVHMNLSDSVTDATEDSMQEDSADNVGNAALDVLIDGYSDADIESAKQVVLDYFEYVFTGCTIKELYYDEPSTKLTNTEWAEQYNDREAIVFTSSFAVDETGGDGSLEPNRIYTNWQWILSRSDKGEWKLRTCGYGSYAGTENKEITYEQVHLYSEPDSDKVCIRVTPSGIREYVYYYFVPEDGWRNKLEAMMSNLEKNWREKGWQKYNIQDFNMQWEDMKDAGWQISYNGIEYRAFRGGYLYALYEDEHSSMELWLHDEEVYDYVEQMLSDCLDYKPVDITAIEDIVSAKLDICSISTNWEYYSQTVTDKETLKIFENWFRNAEYKSGGYDCGASDSCLELTLENGEVIKMSLATDGCPVLVVNGVWYDYRPTSDWQNPEFYKYFDEIPWDFK